MCIFYLTQVFTQVAVLDGTLRLLGNAGHDGDSLHVSSREVGHKVNRQHQRGEATHSSSHLNGVLPLGCLARQHDAISSVQYGVGHIRAFSTGGSGRFAHRLEHLGGANHRLASPRGGHWLAGPRDDTGMQHIHVALGNHHLLGQEHLLGWDFNAEIATRHHDAVNLLQNLVKVLHACKTVDTVGGGD